MFGKCVTTVFAGLGVSFLFMIIWVAIAIIPDPPYEEIQGRTIFFMTRPIVLLSAAIIVWVMGMAGFAGYLFNDNTTLDHAKQTPEDH